MIDHYTLLVRDYARSKAFYTTVLEPIGYGLVVELTRETVKSLGVPVTCGFGTNKPDLWIAPSEGEIAPTHIAFLAASRAEVDAFHRTALAAGGRDNGPPGVRAYYHPNYYGAFILDPDGYNIEAVCHSGE
ncbi:Glyoxalase-like domain protein [Enhygromyxa salina]|uniref:Glyoxalase-like domain protein n=1 Tax=Enhygromyxa salina TaxID=215803 RepID=A0A2S9YFF7_9BACT|nr:VOC family protein [Enhygromyxa salina]PRQ03840.1 Glyoxalase-like domain protein [Enhygromyxa salina]